MRLGIGHPGDKARVTGHVLGDFAKKDHDWLGPLLNIVAENVPLLVAGDDSSFMNKVHLALAPEKPEKKASGAASAKKQSHIAQARPREKETPSVSGPMADMLKKIFKGKE
jgi:PTH1 family peptidyl-tRNA hydrolase